MQLLAGAALLMVAGASQAQYVWVDEKGIRQYSDRSPPASVPLKNILKAPRSAGIDLVTASVDAAPKATPKPALAAAPPSLADREADYKKRQLAQAELDKKAAADAKDAAYKKERCNAARMAKAQLDSGVRIRTGTEGDYMDDAQRAQAHDKVRSNLADCN